MQPVEDVDIVVKPPDIREVLLDAFGLPKPGLDICLCVISEGPLPAGEVAEKLGYDRTTVTRYLNKLVELGLLKRSELNREGGGIVNVYHSIDVERMRRETLVGFYRRSRPSASGLAPEGEGRTLITQTTVPRDTVATGVNDRNPKQLPAVARKYDTSQHPATAGETGVVGRSGAADPHGRSERSGVNSSRPISGRSRGIKFACVRPPVSGPHGQNGEASGLVPEVLHMWAGEAASLIEDANLTKQEYLADNPDQDLPDVFWESFSDT